MSDFITTPEEVKEIFGKYFTYNELKCKCGCDKLKLDRSLAELLLQFRVLINNPVIIRSAYRCKNHKDYSRNHDGYAIDIETRDSVQRYYQIKYIMLIGINRIGIDFLNNFIHFDINPEFYDTHNEVVLFGY